LPEATVDFLKLFVVGTSVIVTVVLFFLITIIVSNSRMRRRQLALKKSEEKYRSLFERSKDAILICSTAGTILDINEAGIDLFGFFSAEEILEHNMEELYPHKEHFDSLFKTLTTKGFVKDRELILQRKDGLTLTVLESSTAVLDDKEQIVAYQSIFHDLTQWKKLEEELFNAQKLESIATLAGGIAHDFNNILAVILMNTQFGIEDTPTSNPLHNRFEEIKKAASFASELTTKLLTFSRRHEFEPELVNLNKLIQENENMLASLLGDAITLNLNLAQNLPCLFATPIQLQQILMNLTTNAKDAMPDGGILNISTTCMESGELPYLQDTSSETEDYIRLTIEDNGFGMDEITVKKIFEPFFTTKEVGKGTGLGLAVVYGVVERHKGYIDVEGKPGKGTTFSIFLPATHVQPKEKVGAGKAAAKFQEKSLTILMAEDYERLLRTNEQILQRVGYNVISTQNGEEAVKAFEQNCAEIDLAVLDVVMPHLGGVEAYQKMQSMKPHLPVLFLTGYDSGRTLDNLRKLKKEHIMILNKPYYMEEFIEKIESLSKMAAP